MVDMSAHFQKLRQKLDWATDADLDKFLSAVTHTFTDIVQVCPLIVAVWKVPLLAVMSCCSQCLSAKQTLLTQVL